MTTALATSQPDLDPAIVESVLIGGDLSKLNPKQRVSYYQAVCKSIGLNPLTKPFDYISLNGKLVLYAKRDATDQLRRLNNISIDKPEILIEDEWIIVTVLAKTGDGRTDSDVGVVSRKDMQGNYGNALMKAVTKSKRRVTLSICGLGWLDETEVENIPGATPVVLNADAAGLSPFELLPEALRDNIEKAFRLLELTAGDRHAKLHQFLGDPQYGTAEKAAECLLEWCRDTYAERQNRPREKKAVTNGMTANATGAVPPEPMRATSTSSGATPRAEVF